MAVPVRIQPHPFKKNIARLVREGSITLGDSSLVDDGMIKVFNATPDDLSLGSIAGNLAGLCKGLADASSLLSGNIVIIGVNSAAARPTLPGHSKNSPIRSHANGKPAQCSFVVVRGTLNAGNSYAGACRFGRESAT
jgi:hypothetical protein